MKARIFKGFPTVSWHDKPYAGLGELVSDLQNAFADQRELMELCEVDKLPDDDAFIVTAQNLMHEGAEAIEFAGSITKPWKKHLEIDLEHVREEWIDVLFFWLQGAIILDILPHDVYSEYMKKFVVNRKRIEAKKAEK